MNKRVKKWDLFFSYNWGKNGLNKEKVKSIYDQIKQKLPNIEIWWEQNQLKESQISEKIREGVQNCSLFISFITSEYSKSKNSMAELALAWNYNIPILFYLNEETTGKNNTEIIDKVFNDTAFYLGSSLYYKRVEQLIEAIELKLAECKQVSGKIESVKLLEETNIVISYHRNIAGIVNSLHKELKSLISVNYHSTDFVNEKETLDKITKADLVLILFNYDYVSNKYCRADFVNLKNRPNVLKINLTTESQFSPEVASEFKFDKNRSIDFTVDSNRDYLNGKGKCFYELVRKMKEILPRPFVSKKSTDITIVGTSEDISRIKAKKEYAGMRIATLTPNEGALPDYKRVDDTKLMMVIVNEAVNNSQSSIEEIKYSKLMKTDMIFVEDNSVKNVNADLKAISDNNKPENNLKSIDEIQKDEFVDQLKQNVKHIDNRTHLLAETVGQKVILQLKYI